MTSHITANLTYTIMLNTARIIARMAVDSERETNPIRAKALHAEAKRKRDHHAHPDTMTPTEIRAFDSAIAQFALQFREENQ